MSERLTIVVSVEVPADLIEALDIPGRGVAEMIVPELIDEVGEQVDEFRRAHGF